MPTNDTMAVKPAECSVNLELLGHIVRYINDKIEKGEREIVFSDNHETLHWLQIKSVREGITDAVKESVAQQFTRGGWVDVRWDRTSGKLTNLRFSVRNPHPVTAEQIPVLALQRDCPLFEFQLNDVISFKTLEGAAKASCVAFAHTAKITGRVLHMDMTVRDISPEEQAKYLELAEDWEALK